MTTSKILISIAVMALVTYIIRVLPMAIFRKKIKNRFVQSFLAYVPYAVLSAMTFPAIFTCTQSPISAGAGCLTAIFLAYLGKSLLTVAVGASLAVYLIQLFPI